MRGAAIATNYACMFKAVILGSLIAATDHGKRAAAIVAAIVAAMAALPRAAAGGGPT